MTMELSDLYQIYATNPDHFPDILSAVYKGNIYHLLEKVQKSRLFISEEKCQDSSRDRFIKEEIHTIQVMFDDAIEFSKWFLDFDVVRDTITGSDMLDFFVSLRRLATLIVEPSSDSREDFIRGRDCALFSIKEIESCLIRARSNLLYIPEYFDIAK